MTAVLLVLAGVVLLIGRPRRRPRGRRRLPDPPRVTAAAVGLAAALVAGGVGGIVVGGLAAVAIDRILRRLEPAAVRRQREFRVAELPLTLDLLGVCLRAGLPLVAALETVTDAVPGPLSDELRVVAGLQRLGATPAAAWAELADDPALAPVARVVARSAESGSRLADAFERLAADGRAARTAAGLARARTAGVAAMAPLGVCFLPAFVCLSVVPIVLSLLEGVFR